MTTVIAPTRPDGGTNVIQRETEASETKTNIIGAFWFSIFGDLAYFLILAIVGLLGWVSVIPGLVLMAVPVVWFVMWFFRVPEFFIFHLPWLRVQLRPFRIQYAPLSFASSRDITLRVTGLASVLIGAICGRSIWDWITAYGAVGQLWGYTVMSFVFPWYVYAGAAGLLLVFGIRRQWKAGLAVLSCAATAWGVYRMGTSVHVASAWSAIIARARYVAIPFLIPPLIGCALVMASTAKNILFPYLNFNLKAIGFDEAREVGLAGLWFPKLLGGPTKEPVPDRLIRVEVQENEGRKRTYANLTGSPAFVEFCKALNGSAPFSLREARKCGMSRREFEKVRDIFFARGWARWSNVKSKRQSVELLIAGQHIVENIALDRSVN